MIWRLRGDICYDVCNIRSFASVWHPELNCVVCSVLFHSCGEQKKTKHYLQCSCCFQRVTRLTSPGEKLKYIACVGA